MSLYSPKIKREIKEREKVTRMSRLAICISSSAFGLYRSLSILSSSLTKFRQQLSATISKNSRCITKGSPFTVNALDAILSPRQHTRCILALNIEILMYIVEINFYRAMFSEILISLHRSEMQLCYNKSSNIIAIIDCKMF